MGDIHGQDGTSIRCESFTDLFTGSNSRWFQIANKLGDTLRQSLLLYEIRHAFNKTQTPVIGELIDPEVVKSFEKDAKGLMAFLREETLKLKPKK